MIAADRPEVAQVSDSQSNFQEGLIVRRSDYGGTVILPLGVEGRGDGNEVRLPS